MSKKFLSLLKIRLYKVLDNEKLGARSSIDNALQDKDLTGRTVIITGPNYCIDFETIQSLAEKYFSHYNLTRSPKEENNPKTVKKSWGLSKKWLKGLQPNSTIIKSATKF
jgi:hypothetical protein